MARSGFYQYQPLNPSTSTAALGVPPRRRIIYMTPPSGLVTAADLAATGRWRAYRQRLESLGAEVRVVSSAVLEDGTRASDFSREVFTRDRAVIIGNAAFLPDISEEAFNRYGVRDWESASFRAVDGAFRARLQQDGFNIVTTTGHAFQGGNLVYDRTSNTLFIGIARGFTLEPSEDAEGRRNADLLQVQYIERNAELASFFQARGINVEFVPLSNNTRTRFYHFDTAMMVLPNGELLVCPDAITPNAFARLQQAFEGRRIITLTEAEARDFPSNMVSIGNTLVPTGITPALAARLEGLGYRVIPPEQVGPGVTSGFFADGGVHCITNSVHLPTMPVGEGAPPGRVGPLSERHERDGTILTTVPGSTDGGWASEVPGFRPQP